MELKISKQEIFYEVEKRSSIEGFSLPERYDNVWANEDRGEILDSYLVEGCTAVIQLMKRYLSSQTIEHSVNVYDDDEVFTISVVMPERYNSLLDGNVSTDVKMLIACNVLSGWFRVVSPDSAAKYDEEAKGYAEDLRTKLLYRIDPKSTSSAAKTDSEEMDVEEEALSTSKTDSEEMGVENEVLSTAKVDNVVVAQEWNGCCRCGKIH